jgi:hypothetical protein
MGCGLILHPATTFLDCKWLSAQFREKLKLPNEIKIHRCKYRDPVPGDDGDNRMDAEEEGKAE